MPDLKKCHQSITNCSTFMWPNGGFFSSLRTVGGGFLVVWSWIRGGFEKYYWPAGGGKCV